ncbi:MAG: hypothetical protein RSD90_03430 [Anaerovoracaceae bacterium]
MLKQKIKAQNGATILLALLFFLLCAVAGSVVLAAGSASGGRLAGIDELQQSYYTVTSAAQVVRDEIDGESFLYEVVTVNDGTPTKTAKLVGNGAFSDELSKAAIELFNYKNKTEFTDTLSLSLSNSTYTNRVKSVRGDFKMNSDYSVTIKLYIEDTKLKDVYLCTLSIPAITDTRSVEVIEKSPDGKTTTKTITKTTTFKWTKGTITKG